MTISSSRFLEATTSSFPDGKFPTNPPPRLWKAIEPPFHGLQPHPSDGYDRSNGDSAIVIDNGAGLVRAGWSFDSAPRLSFPAIAARYRDRKMNRTCSYVGYDAYADATTRGQIRTAFEPGTSIISNWDVMEAVLDSVFVKLGVDGEDVGVGRPVLLTEPLANLGYSRRSRYISPITSRGADKWQQ